MMLPGYHQLILYQGDTNRWRFLLWRDEAHSVPADLTGVVPLAQIRDRPNGEVIVTLESGLEDVTPNNVIWATLPAAECMKLPNTGAWDLQIVWLSGDVQTVLAGPVTTYSQVSDAPQAVPIA